MLASTWAHSNNNKSIKVTQQAVMSHSIKRSYGKLPSTSITLQITTINKNKLFTLPVLYIRAKKFKYHIK